MKFDYTVGNPPYQKATPEGKSTSNPKPLWHEFIYSSMKYLKDDKSKLSFVVPTGWLQANKIGKFVRNHLIEATTKGVSKHFDVGSTFSVIILSKNPGKTFKIDGVEYNRKMPYFPKELNEMSMSITKKLQNSECFVFKGISTFSSFSKKDKFVNDGKYRVYHTPKITLRTNEKPADYDKTKVMLSTSAPKEFLIDKKFTISEVPRYMVIDEKYLENSKSIFNSTLYKFFLQTFRICGMLSKTLVMHHIPKLDLTRSWTDEQIYEHFKLTEDEINYVENNA